VGGESELESLGFPPFPYNFAKPPLQAFERGVDFVDVLHESRVFNPLTHKKAAQLVIWNACVCADELETDAKVRDRPIVATPRVNVLFIVKNDIPWC
jgi:hypothetical protein